MMKDKQMPDKPPGRVLLRSLFQEEQGMRKEKPVLSIRVSDVKLPIIVKENVKTVNMQSINSDGLEKSDTSLRTGI